MTDFATAQSDIPNTAIDRLMVGAIDLHLHSGPSLLERRLDHVEAGRQAEAAGMAAVALKDHYYSVTPSVRLLEKYEFSDSPLRLLSGIVLNNAVGGFNTYAVEHTLKLGGRIVWMPTISAANHIRQTRRSSALPKGHLPPTALSVLDERGVLLDSVRSILDLIARHDAVLATGHLHLSEILPLLAEARDRGVSRLLVNHPSFLVGAEAADMTELANMGAYLEHCAYMLVDRPDQRHHGAAFKSFIQAGGIERTILSSDLGQITHPPPVEGLRALIRLCLELGYGDEEVRQMVSVNAATLVGIDLKSSRGAP